MISSPLLQEISSNYHRGSELHAPATNMLQDYPTDMCKPVPILLRVPRIEFHLWRWMPRISFFSATIGSFIQPSDLLLKSRWTQARTARNSWLATCGIAMGALLALKRSTVTLAWLSAVFWLIFFSHSANDCEPSRFSFRVDILPRSSLNE